MRLWFAIGLAGLASLVGFAPHRTEPPSTPLPTPPSTPTPTLTKLVDTATSPNAIEASAPTKPPALFAQCASCHSLEAGVHFFGPSLANIANRKAASLPDYKYSPALQAKATAEDIVWQADTLDRWLTSPRKMVPGTRMSFVGIRDPKKRNEMVEFLLTLEAN